MVAAVGSVLSEDFASPGYQQNGFNCHLPVTLCASSPGQGGERMAGRGWQGSVFNPATDLPAFAQVPAPPQFS